MQVAAAHFYDELVDQCKQGSQSGYRLLYDRYVRAMFNTSLRIVNHAADAEDIVQEAFIEVFRNMERFTYQSTFGVWMKRIVINKSINHLRQKRHAFVDITTMVENNLSDEPAVDEEEMEWKVESIRKAVHMLPDGYRAIFTLRAFEEYDYEAIADVFAISPVTARTQYHRAKKLLLTLLKQHV